MTHKHAFQPAASPAEQPEGNLDVAGRLRQLLGVSKRELLTMEQVAADYRFPSAEAARKFIHRHGVPFLKRGLRVLVDRRDFDAAIRPKKTA